MLNRGIQCLLAGIILPYIGIWFASTFMLGYGSQPNFLPAQIASCLTWLLSLGIYFLSKIEKNLYLRLICTFVALGYIVSGIAYIAMSSDGEVSSYSGMLFFQLTYFFKTSLAVLAGILVLRNCKVIDEEI